MFCHAVAYAAHRVLLYAVDASAHAFSETRAPLRTQPGAPLRVGTLLLNSAVEHLFLWRAAVLTSELPLLSTRFFLGLYALFLLDDAMYTPFHRLLHTRWLYERVHAQHHEARFPSRGYADAANEHLLEQVGALSIHFAALRLLIALDLLDALAVGLHLLLKAFGSCLNHLDRDVRLSLGCGVVLSSRYHRDHHVYRRCNYSQFVPLFDRLWGGPKRSP